MIGYMIWWCYSPHSVILAAGGQWNFERSAVASEVGLQVSCGTHTVDALIVIYSLGRLRLPFVCRCASTILRESKLAGAFVASPWCLPTYTRTIPRYNEFFHFSRCVRCFPLQQTLIFQPRHRWSFFCSLQAYPTFAFECCSAPIISARQSHLWCLSLGTCTVAERHFLVVMLVPFVLEVVYVEQLWSALFVSILPWRCVRIVCCSPLPQCDFTFRRLVIFY